MFLWHLHLNIVFDEVTCHDGLVWKRYYCIVHDLYSIHKPMYNRLYMKFINQRIFQNCLSASAINTKFHSHGLRGRDIANSLNESLKKMEELSFNYRLITC